MTSPALPDPRAYIVMADEIRQAITAGKYKTGDPAPSVTALHHETGHARQTCARALQILEDENLVVRFPGLGYFVSAAPAAQPRPRNPDKAKESQ